jgi:hypothetical protein
VYQAVEKIPYLLETLESHTGPNKTLLMELFTNPALMLNLCPAIVAILDL